MGLERVDVVCFGMITPAMVIVVDEMPAWNSGAVWKQGKEFISDDAAIVAVLLRQWGVSSSLIGTCLGDDPRGHATAQQLIDAGVAGEFRLSTGVTTPFEINVSDGSGARTYFWRRDSDVLDTLDSADLSLIDGSKLLYADWYDGDHILRPMKMAQQLGVPVFLNIEHSHHDRALLERLAPLVSVCQAVTNHDQTANNADEVADKLLVSGVDTALVTMAKDGCLVANRENACWSVLPPSMSWTDARREQPSLPDFSMVCCMDGTQRRARDSQWQRGHYSAP